MKKKEKLDPNKIGCIAEKFIEETFKKTGYKISKTEPKKITERTPVRDDEGKIIKYKTWSYYPLAEFGDFLIDNKFYIEVKAIHVNSKNKTNKLTSYQIKNYPNSDKPVYIALCFVEDDEVASYNINSWNGKRKFYSSRQGYSTDFSL